MAAWRKQQGNRYHQEGQWRSSSCKGKPPLDNRFPIPTVPSWEKKFCASVGSVPWGKVVENKRYIYLHDNVMNWDDSAVKEAFDNAKYRFFAEINGFPCDIPLPDPNVYIDDVDSNASVDTELYLDLERELEVTNVDEKGEAVVIFGDSFILNHSFSGPGWGDDDEETKQFEIKYDSPGWGSNQHRNNERNSWEQCAALVDSRNVSEEWNRREGYGDDLCHKYQQGRNGGNGFSYNRNRENNMTWSKNVGCHHGMNEYQINRGRRRNRGGGGGGGRRGNFVYMEKGPTPRPSAW